eukprot:753039-Hanusia_phi.AAC.3
MRGGAGKDDEDEDEDEDENKDALFSREEAAILCWCVCDISKLIAQMDGKACFEPSWGGVSCGGARELLTGSESESGSLREAPRGADGGGTERTLDRQEAGRSEEHNRIRTRNSLCWTKRKPASLMPSK